MTINQFLNLSLALKKQLQYFAPIDTGNLRYNAIKTEYISKNEIHIYVDEAIAPYMPYTNEPWLSPKWKGKKNPNERWFDTTAGIIARIISEEYKGHILKEVK